MKNNRMNLYSFKTLILSSLLLILPCKTTLACECVNILIDLPVKEMGWTQTETTGISSISDVIFTGILIDSKQVEERYQSLFYYEEKENMVELTFKLLKSYKGDKADIMKIRTNFGDAACGFSAQLNTECLIFATRGKGGYYYTYRSDCCKSISKDGDVKRYDKYIKFLESITNMIDGNYVFYQSRGYWNGGKEETIENLEAIRYSIKNGKFEGLWKITDRKGRVLEYGTYKNGKKIGTWKVVSFTDSDLKNADEQIKTEKIKYRNGLPHKSNVVIEDRVFIWKLDAKEPYQTIRVQKIRKNYKYYKLK